MNTGSKVRVDSKSFFSRRQHMLGLFLLIYLGLSFSLQAQIKKYPANISPIIGRPYSLFLTDYSISGSNHLTANIVFNDFNEAQWNFRLRIKLESSQVRLETTTDFRPSAPITLAPGVAKSLSGVDWEEYLNYNNLNISGVSVSDLIATGGRLPEGFYSFCFQVLDYDTGDPLSEEMCQTAWLKLMDPPRINLPLCGNNLDSKQTQHVFSWQLFDTVSPNATQGTNFQLTIWEVTESGSNIQTAIANGQALQIFQTQELTQANYLYSLGDPPLELGKQYIYRVQAIDPEGRDKFKNQGYSEYCTFFYGWPTGGHIALQFPIQGGGFKKKDIPYVKWSAVDKLLTGQPVSYEIKVAPIDAGQTKEQAIENNSPWYYDNTPPASIHYDRSQQMDKQLKVMTQYAWQVKAFTDQQQVGKSDISYFNGPSLMENFWAGVHRIAVDYIDGINLNDISGEGRIRLTPESEAWVPVKFNHIQLHDEGDFYVMTGGEFFYQPPALVAVELKADVEKNGKAFFDVSRYRINKEGIYVEGNVRWPFPFATLSNTLASVKSDKQWANYNNFTVNTATRIAEGNQFKLLEPLQFTLSLSKTGIIYIYNNEYRFELNGTVDLPEKVKGTLPGIVQFPFRRADQLFYVEQDSIGGNSIISPFAKSNVQVVTRKYLLDLSEEQSPEKLNADARWKGIYIKDFDLGLNPLLDGNGQLDVAEKINTNLLTTVDTPTEAWISASGLNLKMDIAYPDSSVLKFQTFPSSVRRFRLEVQESQIVSTNSFLKGDFIIPVISNEKRFQYTIPVTNVGFQDGYLENLIDTKFTFNAGGGDQEIKVKVKRAVLSAYEKISMTIDLEWPSMGVTLTDLRGFNAWGDYTVGFDNRNGTVPLTQRHNASLSGYPVTIAVIGAASNDGNYILATTADAGLGDDVSGGEGVPSINVYSMVENKYVPADASGQVGVNTTKQIPFAEASASATKSFTDLQSELSQKVEANQEQLLSDAEALKNEVSASTANVYSPEDMVGSDSTAVSQEGGIGVENTAGGKFNSRQQEIIYEIASGFVEEIAKPITGPVKRMTDSLNNVIARKVNALVDSISKVVVTKVDAVIVPFADNLAEKLRNDQINVVDPIKAMGRQTSRRISEEITSALHTTANENILTPIKTLLIDKVNGRINKHINVNGTRIVYSVLIGNGGNAEDALKQLVDGVPAVLDSILLDVTAFVSMDNIKSTISATASGFIQNISLSDVGHDLRRAGEDILKDMVNEKVNQVVSGLAQKYADDLGLGGFGIGGENPIDFVGVAKRFSTGNVKDAFAIDPVRVQLKTPVIDLDGFMSYTPKHPVYGDVWLGDIDMTIKVPKKFAFNAIYFNGRKDSISYWFCQITPPEDGGNTAYELGKPLSKKPKALKDPVNIGIAQIVGASGRLYHHMIETPGSGIVPNAEMNYGAYMHFVFYDKGNNGKNLRLEVSGEINSKENGDYTIEFLGNLQTQSVKPEIFDIDKLAVVQGTVEVRYNSAEEHFFGYAKVVVNSPGKLCGQASLLVDVKPGKWRIAIGSREERVVFTPGCAGWAPTGWIDLNESTAELGLGVQYSGKATSGFDAKLISVDLTVDAGFAFGILAVVQYKPTFDLMRAGVWVDIWANVDATYKFAWGKSHTINLVQIYIRGDLVIIFNPPPTTLEGNLNGKVKVLSFNINFDAHMKKQI